MTHLPFSLSSLLLCLLCSYSAWADKGPNYTDYVPRYRSISNQVMLDKVAFYPEKTVLHIRFIAAQDQQVHFAGSSSKECWQVQTPRRGRSVRVLERATDAINIRVNNELKHAAIQDKDVADVSLHRGDLLTYQLVFEPMPDIVREVELIAQRRLNQDLRITNLLLKTEEGEYLGTENQMKQVIRRFNERFAFMRHPEIVEIEEVAQKVENQTALATRALGFIKSEPEKAKDPRFVKRPKSLRSLQDLQCEERVILSDVHFQDDKAQIVGRVKANRTLRLVVQHLKYHSQSRIVLHGHTDVYGNHYENLALSRERVLNVKRALTLMGVDDRRILTFYYGGEHPLPGLGDGGAANRRVELEVICEQ